MQVQYFGGDPRIKFVTSEDGTELEINAYDHYVKSKRGEGIDQIVNISSMSRVEVQELLAARGVRSTVEKQRNWADTNQKEL